MCFLLVIVSLVVSTSAVDCLEKLVMKDLLYVEWDVTLYSLCN